MEGFYNVYLGDCIELMPLLENKSIKACVTSPPYANQRANFYDGVSAEEYPEWTVRWMESLRPKLTNDGSALIIIRPHLKNGQISDYVLKTRLALRESGWLECEELIWHKPDAPPLGSIYRPRRTWEQILWFSLNKNPFVDLKACGNKNSEKTGGFVGSERFGDGNVIAKNQTRKTKKGTSRCPDVFLAHIGEIEKGVMHPAMFPQTLANQLIQTFTVKGDTVIDPFAGSGTTGLAAIEFGRNFIGVDSQKKYVELSKKRIAEKFPD